MFLTDVRDNKCWLKIYYNHFSFLAFRLWLTFSFWTWKCDCLWITVCNTVVLFSIGGNTFNVFQTIRVWSPVVRGDHNIKIWVTEFIKSVSKGIFHIFSDTVIGWAIFHCIGTWSCQNGFINFSIFWTLCSTHDKTFFAKNFCKKSRFMSQNVNCETYSFSDWDSLPKYWPHAAISLVLSVTKQL